MPLNLSKQKASEELLEKYRNYLNKALKHLSYSRKKVSALPTRLSENDEETLETWESFTTRFSRVVDLFLTKYIKLRLKFEDPAFEGSLRDNLNFCEKMNWLNDVDRWIAMRELRNIQAHDYTDDSFADFVKAVMTESDYLLSKISEVILK